MRPAPALVAPALLGLSLAACQGASPPDDPTSGAPVTSTPSPGGPTPAADDGTPTTGTADGGVVTEESATSTATASDVVPAVDVEVVAEGLSLPWDVQFLPDGTALVTERGGRLLALDPAGGEPREVELGVPGLFVGSEAGLMGLAVSPTFEESRQVFVCHASQAAGEPPDVRVSRLLVDEAVEVASPEAAVVTGMPLTSGRHSGCRLLFTPDGTLLVGTGDAADGRNPQDLTSLGGKVLAVDENGEAVEAGGHIEGGDPRILTYGHRNVQGLAVQPGTGAIWEVEHGPSTDDEVNVLTPGANYGWDPVPGYDESVPMTDLDAFPDAVEAVWSSGSPTHATSGAVFLEGTAWGAWDGALAVAELKGSGVTVLRVDGQTVTGEARMKELEGTFGRLRSLTLDAEGVLWVTSSNGDGDVVLRVTPRS